jgi:hypothetical protein
MRCRVVGWNRPGEAKHKKRENNPMQSRMAPEKRLDVASQPNLTPL